MERSIMDWLKQIEDPDIRARAIKNRIAYLKRHPNLTGGTRTNMFHAIDAAFGWQSTPEGHQYWQDIQSQYN